jgi:hypothetical protein
MNRRPRLEIVAPGASPAEAAAVVAALERFMRETAPGGKWRAQDKDLPRQPAWLRSALLEGVNREDDGSQPGAMLLFINRGNQTGF